ncbi:MAG: glycosyltransferase family 2 protein [Phycisphaerae bacterium]|nr:glycosyltransferase family 2 protein [Phycisphaerae bacterium]
MNDSISVIVPTHDRPESLRRVVRSVLDQSLLPDELIIVNDGDEEIPADIAEMVRKAGVRFIYRRRERPSLPASRNVGIDASTGEILLLLDDDVELGRKFLAEMSNMYDADVDRRVDGIGAVGTDLGVGLVSGNRKLSSAKNRDWSIRLWDVLVFLTAHTRWLPRRCLARSVRLPSGLRGLLIPVKFLTGGRISVRRRVVESVRFNETFIGYAVAEDRDFSYRATQQFAMFIAPSLKLIHHCDRASRPDSFAWGRMMAMNHIRVAADALEPGAGKWTLLVWDLVGMTVVHAVYAVIGDRKFHAGMAKGLLAGAARAAADAIKRQLCAC